MLLGKKSWGIYLVNIQCDQMGYIILQYLANLQHWKDAQMIDILLKEDSKFCQTLNNKLFDKDF